MVFEESPFIWGFACLMQFDDGLRGLFTKDWHATNMKLLYCFTLESYLLSLSTHLGELEILRRRLREDESTHLSIMGAKYEDLDDSTEHWFDFFTGAFNFCVSRKFVVSGLRNIFILKMVRESGLVAILILFN